MKKALLFSLMAAVLLAVAGSAKAVTMNTYDWDSGEGMGTVRVSEIFFTASEISGSALDLTPGVNDNLYLYTLTNLSGDSSITLFRLSNPDSDTAILYSPAGWEGSAGTVSPTWAASEADAYIDPGSALSGFELFSAADSSSLSYQISEIGWIEFFGGSSSSSLDELETATQVAVPEPLGFIFPGLGLIVFSTVRKRFALR
jgi:hypothetical protein